MFCSDGDWTNNAADGAQFVELDEREDGKAIRYELSKKTGRTSVPQIWIDGEYVGGCNDGARAFLSRKFHLSFWFDVLARGIDRPGSRVTNDLSPGKAAICAYLRMRRRMTHTLG